MKVTATTDLPNFLLFSHKDFLSFRNIFVCQQVGKTRRKMYFFNFPLVSWVYCTVSFQLDVAEWLQFALRRDVRSVDGLLWLFVGILLAESCRVCRCIWFFEACEKNGNNSNNNSNWRGYTENCNERNCAVRSSSNSGMGMNCQNNCGNVSNSAK